MFMISFGERVYLLIGQATNNGVELFAALANYFCHACPTAAFRRG